MRQHVYALGRFLATTLMKFWTKSDGLQHDEHWSAMAKETKNLSQNMLLQRPSVLQLQFIKNNRTTLIRCCLNSGHAKLMTTMVIAMMTAQPMWSRRPFERHKHSTMTHVCNIPFFSLKIKVNTYFCWFYKSDFGPTLPLLYLVKYYIRY